MNLRELIIKALKILSLNDRDLRTIVIYCNLHNSGHYRLLGGYPNEMVLKELETMEKENLISKQKKIIKREFELWSLIDEKTPKF